MGDVTDDYGKRVGTALRAVRQLHADASRLLSDCDGTIGKRREVCGGRNTGTERLSSLLGERWMPEGAYRCYGPAAGEPAGQVDAVCLCFFGETVAKDEPVLIAGRIEYALDPGQGLEAVWSGWDVWYLLSHNCPERTHGAVLTGGPVTWTDDGKAFTGFRLIAVPLYSITSTDDVVALMERVRAADLRSVHNPA